MKYIVFIILVACGLNTYGQSIETRIPLENGITHHTIEENKIQLMKDANLALEEIKKYKRNRNTGYFLVGCGAGVLYYACDHMEVPLKYTGYNRSDYLNKRNQRRVVGLVGGTIMGVGTYFIIRSNKTLKNAEIRLQPNGGGIRFYF